MKALLLTIAPIMTLAACGSVADTTPDGTSADGATQSSIGSVHRVFEMKRADTGLSTSVTTAAGKALIIAAGSGQSANGFPIGMSIRVDGVTVGTSRSATNEINSSKAFVRSTMLVDMTAGAHAITIEPIAGTTMNANDFVDLTVIELGAGANAVPLIGDGSPPYTATLTGAGGQGVMLVGGSGFSEAAAATLGMDVRLDNLSVGTLKMFSNEATSHKTLGVSELLLTLGSGSKTVDLVNLAGTSTDYNDRASALWLGFGSDVSASKVIDGKIGPLPLTSSFTSTGCPVMLLVGGSAFANPPGVLEVGVQVDSVTVGSVKVTTAELNSHKSLVPTVLVAQVGAGTHTVMLNAVGATNTDFNDHFDVTAIELPQ